MVKVLEGFFIGKVVNEDCTMSITQVGRNEASKFLLASSVPQLQPVHTFLVDDVFGEKINSDSMLPIS